MLAFRSSYVYLLWIFFVLLSLLYTTPRRSSLFVPTKSKQSMSINIMAPHSTCLALIKRSRRLIDQRFRCIVIQVSWHLYGHLENDKRLRRTFEDILLKTATSSISTFGGKSRHFFQVTKVPKAHCLKITEKVSFNFACEASYINIYSGQMFINNAKNGQFWRVFVNLKLAI